MKLQHLLLLLALLAVTAACAQDAPPLIQSSGPVSIGLRLQGATYEATIEARQPSTVNLYCPSKPGLIKFDGLAATVDVTYDQQTRMLQLQLPEGKYHITIRSL